MSKLKSYVGVWCVLYTFFICHEGRKDVLNNIMMRYAQCQMSICQCQNGMKTGFLDLHQYAHYRDQSKKEIQFIYI